MDVEEQASERLARQLQEEEDSYAAFQLHTELQLGQHVGGSGLRLTHFTPRLAHLNPPNNSSLHYVISDEEDSDGDPIEILLDSNQQDTSEVQEDEEMPMSPETHVLVTDALLNTAFTAPPLDDEVMIVQDSRPSRQRDQPAAGSASGSDARAGETLVLEVGRSSRSNISHSDNSIVITNNSLPPSANTRSRQNTRSRETPSANIRSRETPSASTRSRESTSSNTRSRESSSTQSQQPLSAAPSTRRNTRSRTSINVRGDAHTIIPDSRPPTQTRSAPSSGTDFRTRSSSRTSSSSRARSSSRPGSSSRPAQSTEVVTVRDLQPSSSSSGPHRDIITISDNQPSTSSGQRYTPSQVSHRLIINGVPIHSRQGEYDRLGLFDYMMSSNFVPNVGMFLQGDTSMSYEEMIALDDENTLQPGQGLSKSSINANTLTKKYSKDSADNASCNICLSDFDDGEKIRTLPCFHSFHVKCIDNWLSRKPECPVCRSSVGR